MKEILDRLEDDTCRVPLQPGAREGMRRLLASGQIPSWFGTSNAVRRRWPVLRRIARLAVTKRWGPMIPQPWASRSVGLNNTEMGLKGHRNLTGL